MKKVATDIHGRPYHRGLVFTLMLLATFAGSLMESTLGTALPTLMRKFSINLSTAQQATTWFLLALAIMVPVSAYLVKRFSTRKLTLTTYALLIIGLITTAFTPETRSMWWMFIVGRVITAAAVGILMPLLQITILKIFSIKERAMMMGLMGLVVGMSPAIGPTLTGWLLDANHHFLGLVLKATWQSIFYAPLAVLIIIFILSIFFMRDILPNVKNIKIDITSLILSSFGFGSFLFGFTNLAGSGWDNLKMVTFPIIIGFVLIIIFIRRQLKLEHPFLDLRVFKKWNFSIATIATIMVMMAMMGIEMILPTYLQNVQNLSVLKSGLVLLPGALLLGIISPLAGLLYTKAGVKWTTIPAFIIIAVGTIPFAFITVSTPDIVIIIMYSIRMIGIALAMMPLTTAAMDALNEDETVDGTAVNSTAQQLASSVGVALLTSITQHVITNNSPATTLRTLNPLKYADLAIQASLKGFQITFAIGLLFAIIGLLVVLLFKQKSGRNIK
ncbi:multidrug efflux MFS transporter [Pediococcus stilesii]|uniref:Multidrug efflux MFS transporter n=1 Tax=Pediococcus stilesii TaxID=331679 RepID=A0A5R9BU09_9LACO|nr:DHA2 family efflux MFS transporter permease subunit [Pediococcus stilesii]TLQ03492.1 multidrug efflux MFS transporter [Pediococcus stilesii]